MKKYAKITEGKISVLTRRPYCSLTTDKNLKEFADANGYKEYRETARPKDGKRYRLTHKETAKRITQIWAEIAEVV